MATVRGIGNTAAPRRGSKFSRGMTGEGMERSRGLQSQGTRKGQEVESSSQVPSREMR